MRAKVQICASGKEEKIRSLHKCLNMVGTVRSLKPTVLTPQNNDVSEWCSNFQECLTEFPEDEIVELLDKGLLATLKAMRGSIDELLVVLVCEHDSGPDDRPRGYSVSLDLIRMLADLGASLEIDIVRDLKSTDSNQSG